MSEFPLAARVAIEDLYAWWRYEQGSPYWDERLRSIADKYQLSYQRVVSYVERLKKLWSGKDINHYVLFVYEKQFRQGLPCVDIRNEGEFLPRETYPLGVFAFGRALMVHTYMRTPEQQEQFYEKVCEVLLMLGDAHAEEKARQLLSEGFVTIKRYGGVPKLHRDKI